MDLGSNDESEAIEEEDSSEAQIEQQPSEPAAPPSLNPSVVLGSGTHFKTAAHDHH